MIIVIGGIKGGSGKTTLATNLTVMRASAKPKVLLIDADPQRSASDWAEQRDALDIKTNWTTIQLTGRTIHKDILKMSEDYDDVIIDAGGRENPSQRSAMSVADVFVTTFKPRSLDIWTIGSVKQLISEIKIVNPSLVCYAVINQADSQGRENDEAKTIISKCPDLTFVPHHIGHRKSFANASADGLGIAELKQVDKKAIAEMTDVYSYIFSTDNDSTIHVMCMYNV